MKQGRLNFSDYSAEQQEADAKKAHRLKVIRHAYLMRVDGEWAHFIIGTHGKDDIDYYGDMELTAVYNKLQRTRPEYTVKVIQNEGLENYLREHRAEYKRRNVRQLKKNLMAGKKGEYERGGIYQITIS